MLHFRLEESSKWMLIPLTSILYIEDVETRDERDPDSRTRTKITTVDGKEWFSELSSSDLYNKIRRAY
jgi:hypothetical protein